MPKHAPDTVLDAPLDVIAGATAMHLCTTLDATPTRAEVLAASLADVVVDAGDFTKADGDVSGRKVTIGAQSAVPIDATGDSNHVALIDATNVRYVTTHTQQNLTSGGTVNIAAWKVEFADPT